MAHDFDVIVVGDARFQGGTTAAMVSDVIAFVGLGLRVGLLFVRSGYLDDRRDPPNPAALALADLDGVTRLSADRPARAAVAFLHHPMVYFHGIEERASLAAEHAVVVCHHPPFRADGSLEYDPMRVLRQARAALGLSAWLAPVSGVVRQQLQVFAPAVRLTSEDWPNVFDADAWPLGPTILTGPAITVGRHGRPDGLKWPGAAAEIAATLPAGPETRVRVLGCPRAELEAQGADLSGWEVLSFGAESPVCFLHSLDVFAYHYHRSWVEAFGRTVAEAALTGRLCLLDPRLRPNFGPDFTYCAPAEVGAILDRMRADPEPWQSSALQVARGMRELLSLASVGARLARLQQDTGTVSRHGVSTGPLRALRKLAGLYRRRIADDKPV